MDLPRARHPCRWNWCRSTFPTNAQLIDHVLFEHVRNAKPVSRKDVSMLRRVEEGLGGPFTLSSLGPQSSHPLPSTSSTSPRPSKRAHIDPGSHTSTGSQANLQSRSQVTNSAYQSVIDQNSIQRQTQAQRPDPTPPTPPTSHAASTPGPSTPAKHKDQNQPAHAPENSQEQLESSPPCRTLFLKLSSPDGTPHSSLSVPASPSFDSQVNDAIKGRKFRALGCDSPPQSQDGDIYAYTDFTSGEEGSQEIVESQLTQGLECDEELDLDRRQNLVLKMDMYDADAEGEREPVSENDSQGPEGMDSWNQRQDIQSQNSMPWLLHTQAQGYLSTITEFQNDDSSQSPSNLQDAPSSPGFSAQYFIQTQEQRRSSPGIQLTDEMPNKAPTQRRRIRPRNSSQSGSLKISPTPPKSRTTQTRRSRTPAEPPSKPPSRQQPRRRTRSTSVVTEPDANREANMDAVAPNLISQAVSQSQASQSQEQSYPAPYYLQTQAPYQSQSSQSLS